MTLAPIMESIELKEIFPNISFHHLYRELNATTNELSKRALSLHIGLDNLEKEKEGVNFPTIIRSIYIVSLL
jgi:hypothetical protein